MKWQVITAVGFGAGFRLIVRSNWVECDSRTIKRDSTNLYTRLAALKSNVKPSQKGKQKLHLLLQQML